MSIKHYSEQPFAPETPEVPQSAGPYQGDSEEMGGQEFGDSVSHIEDFDSLIEYVRTRPGLIPTKTDLPQHEILNKLEELAGCLKNVRDYQLQHPTAIESRDRELRRLVAEQIPKGAVQDKVRKLLRKLRRELKKQRTADDTTDPAPGTEEQVAGPDDEDTPADASGQDNMVETAGANSESGDGEPDPLPKSTHPSKIKDSAPATPAPDVRNVTPAPEAQEEVHAPDVRNVTPAPEAQEEARVPEIQNATPAPRTGAAFNALGGSVDPATYKTMLNMAEKNRGKAPAPSAEAAGKTKRRLGYRNRQRHGVREQTAGGGSGDDGKPKKTPEAGAAGIAREQLRLLKPGDVLELADGSRYRVNIIPVASEPGKVVYDLTNVDNTKDRRRFTLQGLELQRTQIVRVLDAADEEARARAQTPVQEISGADQLEPDQRESVNLAPGDTLREITKQGVRGYVTKIVGVRPDNMFITRIYPPKGEPRDSWADPKRLADAILKGEFALQPAQPDAGVEHVPKQPSAPEAAQRIEPVPNEQTADAQTGQLQEAGFAPEALRPEFKEGDTLVEATQPGKAGTRTRIVRFEPGDMVAVEIQPPSGKRNIKRLSVSRASLEASLASGQFLLEPGAGWDDGGEARIKPSLQKPMEEIQRDMSDKPEPSSPAQVEPSTPPEEGQTHEKAAEGVKQRIRDAQSFDDLMAVLDDIDGIQGADMFFTSSYLKEQALSSRLLCIKVPWLYGDLKDNMDTGQLLSVTPAYGFRDKLREILLSEMQRSKDALRQYNAAHVTTEGKLRSEAGRPDEPASKPEPTEASSDVPTQTTASTLPEIHGKKQQQDSPAEDPGPTSGSEAPSGESLQEYPPVSDHERKEAPQAPPSDAEEFKLQKYSEAWILNEYKRLNIEAADLASIEHYNDLSEGQKAQVLENFKNALLGQIEVEGYKEYIDKTAAASRLYSSWRNMFARYYSAKEKHMSYNRLVAGGIQEHGALLKALVQGSYEHGPEVEITKDGELEIQYIREADFAGELSQEQKQMIQQFNEAATAYANTPAEWTYKTASRAHRKEFQRSLDRFDSARGELMKLYAAQRGENQALSEMNRVHAHVEMNQYLNHHDDAEKALLNIRSNKWWRSALQSTVAERGLYMIGGGAARTAAISGLAAMGVAAALTIPAVVAVTGASLGATVGYLRSRGRFREKDLYASRGLSSHHDETALSVVSPQKTLSKPKGVREVGLTERLRQVAQELNSQSDESVVQTQKSMDHLNKIMRDGVNGKKGREALTSSQQSDYNRVRRLESMRARIQYAEDKLRDGLIDFGLGADRINRAYGFMNALAKAKMAIGRVDQLASLQKTDSTEQVDISEIARRLSSLLEYREEKMEEKRNEENVKMLKRGLKWGAVFSLGGYALLDVFYKTTGWTPGQLLKPLNRLAGKTLVSGADSSAASDALPITPSKEIADQLFNEIDASAEQVGPTTENQPPVIKISKQGQGIIGHLRDMLIDRYNVEPAHASAIANAAYDSDTWPNLVYVGNEAQFNFHGLTPEDIADELSSGDSAAVRKIADQIELVGVEKGTGSEPRMDLPTGGVSKSGALVSRGAEAVVPEHPMAGMRGILYSPEAARFAKAYGIGISEAGVISYDVDGDGVISDQEVLIMTGRNFQEGIDHISVRVNERGNLIVEVFGEHETLKEVLEISSKGDIVNSMTVQLKAAPETMLQPPEKGAGASERSFEVTGRLARKMHSSLERFKHISDTLRVKNSKLHVEIERIPASVAAGKRGDLVSALQKIYGVDLASAKKLSRPLSFIFRKLVQHNITFAEQDTVGGILKGMNLKL